MRSKIVLTTITRVPNYGASLQAFAAKQVLQSFGAVTVLEYDNPVLQSARALVRFGPNAKSILSAGKDLLRLRSRSRLLAKFGRFYEHELGMDSAQTLDELLHGRGKIDACVSGSDQIWNPNCVSANDSFDEAYFLTWAPENSRRIAFSSSMGGYTCSPKKRDQLAKLLHAYDAISVREHDTKIFLEELLDREVRHSLDPSLHLTAAEWASFVPPGERSGMPDEYILTYAVPRLRALGEATRQVADHLKLPVVSIDSDPIPLINTPFRAQDAGPKEFLDLFRNAHFVTTDSFHGVCFAIIHRIPFAAFTTGKHANRIDSLLARLGIQERIFESGRSIREIDKPIDFEMVHSKLQHEKCMDMIFLRNAFNGHS